MRRPRDWSLYLVTDRGLTGSRPLAGVVAAAVRGGVTAVQLREKHCGTREFVELARCLKALLAPCGVPLIVNDRVDVALATDADGVHVGQSDLDCRDARRLLGPDAVVGLSVETMEQAERAAELDVDYLGVSPIFSTPTKTDTAAAWGVAAWRRCARSRSMYWLPSVALTWGTRRRSSAPAPKALRSFRRSARRPIRKPPPARCAGPSIKPGANVAQNRLQTSSS